MKYSFVISTFLTLLFFSNNNAISQSKEIKILVPENGQPQVGKWEKLELGINISNEVATKIRHFVSNSNEKEKLNPFDPNQVSVEATFQNGTNSSIKEHKIFGFYYGEYSRKQNGTGIDDWQWIVERNDYVLRVRFAPDALGPWVCSIKLILNKTETVDLGKINFVCTANQSKGPIALTGTNDARNRYLKYTESNEMFFPVGMNLVWSKLDELRPSDYTVYTKWFDQLSKAKANFVQLSMLPFTNGIEQEVLNNYSARMTHAWELDQLMLIAEKNGIYVNLLTLIHDEFITGEGWIHKNNHWTNNIYNTVRNKGKTTAVNPIDFFAEQECKTEFKKRLRYILSRYGYSTNIPIIELLSEVDNAIPKYRDKTEEGEKVRKIFKDWFIEMKNYIKNDLGYSEKLVSASYTQGAHNKDIENHVYTDSDVILMHLYGSDNYTNFKGRFIDNIVRYKAYAKTSNAPIIFDEMGADFFPSLDQCSDITFHNSLWATALMGSFGTGQSWWWDNALLSNGFEKNLAGIAKFLEDENFSVREFECAGSVDNGSKFKNKSKFETYYLKAKDGTKLVGWLHNISFYWANLKDVNPCIAKLIEDNSGVSIDKADNTPYRKQYEKGKAKGAPQSKTGYKLQLKLNPETEYIIKWYNTSTGELNGTNQTVKSSSSGKIKFDIPEIVYPANLYGDLGYKIVKFTK
jgi:hypothetical protein